MRAVLSGAKHRQGGGRVAAPNVWPGRTEEGSVRYWYCSTVRQLSYCRGKWPSTRAV